MGGETRFGMRPRSDADLDEAFDALIRLGRREGRQQMLTHARLFLKTHPRSSGQDVLEMLEDGCDRFWISGMQIDSKTTIAGVPIRGALRRSDGVFYPEEFTQRLKQPDDRAQVVLNELITDGPGGALARHRRG